MKNFKNHNSANFFSYFDNIYVNNLDYRQDRLQAARIWFDAYGINPTRLGAINGQDEFDNFFNNLESKLQPFAEIVGDKVIQDTIKIYQKAGAQKKIKNANENLRAIFGCSISNLFIILDAYKNNYEHVLLLEDDCQPTVALLEHGESIINEVKNADWKFLSFGKKDRHWNPTKKPNHPGETNPPIFRIMDGHNHLSEYQRGNPTQLHAYAVHSSFYFDYIKVGLQALLGHFDVCVTDSIGIWHATYPSMFFQSKTYSDLKRKSAKTDIPRDGLLFPSTWQYSFNKYNFNQFVTEASFG